MSNDTYDIKKMTSVNLVNLGVLTFGPQQQTSIIFCGTMGHVVLDQKCQQDFCLKYAYLIKLNKIRLMSYLFMSYASFDVK